MVVLWLDEMLDPSGSWTWILLSLNVAFDGVDDWRKWWEQPLSSIAVWLSMVKGGLSEDDKLSGNVVFILRCCCFISYSGPVCQLLGLRTHSRSLPPIRLCSVASLL